MLCQSCHMPRGRGKHARALTFVGRVLDAEQPGAKVVAQLVFFGSLQCSEGERGLTRGSFSCCSG